MIDVFAAVAIWAILLPIRIVAYLMGPFVVAAALPFRMSGFDYRGSHPRFPGWKMIVLPGWAWPWSNDRDGAMGDPDGRYWNRDAPKWLNAFWKMWWWLVVRNPTNNLARFSMLYSINVSRYRVITLGGTENTVRDKLGMEGWQFVNSNRKFPSYGFYLVKRYGKTNHGLVIRLGNKIEPRHNNQKWPDPQKAIKGWTFRIVPFKDLR